MRKTNHGSDSMPDIYISRTNFKIDDEWHM